MKTDFHFDSEQWRALRNSLLQSWVQDAHAIDFLLIIGQTAEVWDDLVDGDKEVTTEEINKTFYTVLTKLPLNPFFDRYKFQLTPLMVTGLNTWQDSDILAKGNANDKAMAYVLRDWYVELVVFSVYLLRGYDAMREVSMEIRRFFSQHESLQAYMEKLS
jgi:hypothetical protein